MARIAVVNDDTAFLSLMGEVLAMNGHHAMIYREGSAAYPLLKADRPDLVIIDIRMDQPEAGWLVSELLKLDPETAPIPIIVCSANVGNLREKQSWLAHHGVGALPKPFDLDDLDSCVTVALETGVPPIIGLEDA